MIADIAGHAIENGVEIVGYMNGDTHQYVTFQHVDGDDDLHFEFDDQANGGYNCVSSATFRDAEVVIETDKAPGGSLRVAVPKSLENGEFVARRLAEILAIHNVAVNFE